MTTLIFRYKTELIHASIFLLLLPIALSINYWHNDEWAHYPSVQNFIEGNFALHPLIGSTFYSMGILSAIFSLVFGIHNLPVLTLLVSVGTVYFINKIIISNSIMNYKAAIMTSLLLLVCPLFVFTMWGFMTDNYFLFFLIVGIYYFDRYIDTRSKKMLLLGIIFIILSYFTRQLGVIVFLSYFIYFFLKKAYKDAFILGVTFALIMYYHYAFFPQTAVMRGVDFIYSNLTYYRYIFSLFWAIGLTVVPFLFPVFVTFIRMQFRNYTNKTSIFTFLFLVVIMYIFSERYFNNIGWIGERLYFFKYTVAHNGFFVENINGTKKPFITENLFYGFLELASKLILCAFIATIILYRQKSRLLNQYFIMVTVYSGVMFLSIKIYDRYLVPIIIFCLLWISTLSRKLDMKITLIWIIILGFYVYNFSADYIKTNNYVYNKAIDIVKTTNVEPNQIRATDLWRYRYPDTKKPRLYEFTYNDEFTYHHADGFKLIEKYQINYPLNFWRGQNIIYLYKLGN